MEGAERFRLAVVRMEGKGADGPKPSLRNERIWRR
jgi:hypothetical protein